MDVLNSQATCLYFAYGSNMNSEQMEKRMVEGPIKLKEFSRWPFESLVIDEKITYLGKGILKGYELNFHKMKTTSNKEGFASLSPNEDSQVEGVIYKVKEIHLYVLDFYEGVKTDHYTKEKVNVEVCATQESHPSAVYIAHPSKIDKERKPSKDYLSGLIKGAREFNLSPETIQKLEKWPTAD